MRKEFDWNRFKTEKIAVHCKTEEEAKDFSEKVNEQNIKWCSKELFIKNNRWNFYKENTCYDYAKTGFGVYNDGMSYTHIGHYKEDNYKIIEWSDYMEKEFTKDDLKPFMLVELRNKYKYIVTVDDILVSNDRDWISLLNYENNLKIEDFYDNKWDIMKVYNIPTRRGWYLDFTTENRELLWERKEVKEMTLSEVCEALGYDVKIIKDKE